MKWQFCGDILEAGTPDAVGFNNPNVAVCGNDLVVVFGASVHDRTGATGPRDVNRSNYIFSTRVANFRARRPEERLARTLLVGDQTVQLTDLDGGIILDGVLQEAYWDGILENAKMSGDFPVLGAGDTAISWTGSVTAVRVTPHWVEI